MEEFAALLKAYGAEGDHDGGEWPRERFERHGIGYAVCGRPRASSVRV